MLSSWGGGFFIGGWVGNGFWMEWRLFYGWVDGWGMGFGWNGGCFIGGWVLGF